MGNHVADGCVQFPVTYNGTKILVTISKEDEPWVSRYTWTASDDGGKSGNIYVYRRGKAKNGKQPKIYLHREVTKAKPGEIVDHRDNNTLLNTRENLRVITRRGNNINRGPNRTYKSRPTSSRFKGVSWNRQSRAWEARIGYNYKSLRLGLFQEERDAAAAYDMKCKELYGEYAWLNFPEKQVIGQAA